MTWAEIFERMVQHYADMAMTPGCWAAAQHQVAAMEQEQGGHWQGLRAEVGRRIKEVSFRPSQNDLAPIEREQQPLPQRRRGYGG